MVRNYHYDRDSPSQVSKEFSRQAICLGGNNAWGPPRQNCETDGVVEPSLKRNRPIFIGAINLHDVIVDGNPKGEAIAAVHAGCLSLKFYRQALELHILPDKNETSTVRKVSAVRLRTPLNLRRICRPLFSMS